MNKRSSYLENKYQETLGDVRQERDALLVKVAALERQLTNHELRKKAEDLLVAASSSDSMPEGLHVYGLSDFIQKRDRLVGAGKDGIQKAAAAVELITTGTAPGFELGSDDPDDDLKDDPLAHIW